MAVSLSPLTGVAGVSNFGGHFGAYLKYAGFDALEITGKSATDVMIVIDGFKREIAIVDAPVIDEVFDLEKAIVERFIREGRERKEIVFLSTGVGASHTTFGCINSHYFDPTKHLDGTKGFFRTKQAGRTGLGTVMIDKKVRAIVVLAEFPHGENPYGAADWEKVKHAGAELGKVVREVDPQSLKMYRKGSAGLIAFMNKEEYQSLPVHNYQLGSDRRAEQITGKYYAEHLFDHRGMDGCFPGCNLRCTKGGWVTLRFGDHKGRRVWVDGPEYETAAGFGSNLGMWNAEFIMEANWHCDNYGIDTITVAVTIAFVMECFQRGYLTREDTDGLALAWGNEEAVISFIRHIALGETKFARVAGQGMLPFSTGLPPDMSGEPGRPIRGRSSSGSPCRRRGSPSRSTGPTGRSRCRAPTPPRATSGHTTPPPGSSRWTSWALSPASRTRRGRLSRIQGFAWGTTTSASASSPGLTSSTPSRRKRPPGTSSSTPPRRGSTRISTMGCWEPI